MDVGTLSFILCTVFARFLHNLPHRMDVGTLSFILCAVFARFLHNLPHRMNVEALSFILCRGSAGDAEEVISSQAGRDLCPLGSLLPV